MDWSTFIISILGSGVIAALVTALINHLTQIKAIKESGLYAKRVDVLDEIMKRMERLDQISGKLVFPFQSDDSDKAEYERSIATGKAFKYFFGYYKRNRHYLPKALSDEISILCSEYKQLYIDFSYDARIPGERPNVTKWIDLFEKHQGELAEKREKVAEEFRKLIGVK